MALFQLSYDPTVKTGAQRIGPGLLNARNFFQPPAGRGRSANAGAADGETPFSHRFSRLPKMARPKVVLPLTAESTDADAPDLPAAATLALTFRFAWQPPIQLDALTPLSSLPGHRPPRHD